MKNCLVCYSNNGFIDAFEEGLKVKQLSDEEMSYINNRYLELTKEASNEATTRSLQFHLLVNIITLSGILIATFTSLMSSDKVPAGSRDGLFWTVIVLGLVATMANKFIYLFNIPKKYIMSQQAQKRYEAEGWHYIGSVGRYLTPDPALKFAIFCDRVEKIQAKRVKDMVSVNNSVATASTGTAQTPRDDTVSILGSPTPRTVITSGIVRPLDKLDKPTTQNTARASTSIPITVTPPDNIGSKNQ